MNNLEHGSGCSEKLIYSVSCIPSYVKFSLTARMSQVETLALKCALCRCLQRQSNASQTLCDIIRLSRDQSNQLQDIPEPDPLLTALES